MLGDVGVSEDARALDDASAGHDAASSLDARPTARDSGPRGSYGDPVALGMLRGVPETSGIIASREHAGVFWVHNDSGNPAQIFAIDQSAQVLSTLTLLGADNEDWEDIAIASHEGRDWLYVADVGDNLARVSRGASSGRIAPVRLYRLEEPDPEEGVGSVAVERLELTYPDGPHDCEAVFVHPHSGDVYLLEKVDAGLAGVYRASSLVAPGPNLLERIGTLDMALVTAADISEDASRIVVRNYVDVRVYVGLAGDVLETLGGAALFPPRASLAEAIAFGASDGSDYDLYTIAEGEGATLFRIAW